MSMKSTKDAARSPREEAELCLRVASALKTSALRKALETEARAKNRPQQMVSSFCFSIYWFIYLFNIFIYLFIYFLTFLFIVDF